MSSRGDNSSDEYRKAMNQNRNGFDTEKLVSSAACGENHTTLK